jgi:hypothetical protein
MPVRPATAYYTTSPIPSSIPSSAARETTFYTTSPIPQLLPSTTIHELAYYTALPIPSILSTTALRETASWIRDVLDPAVAREGCTQLQPDDVLTLHNLLIALRQYSVPLSTIRCSRIHLAVAEICGKATRWPAKLCDEADFVVRELELTFGPLGNIQPPLFERGGRLWNICDQTQLSRTVSCDRIGAASYLVPTACLLGFIQPFRIRFSV